MDDNNKGSRSLKDRLKLVYDSFDKKQLKLLAILVVAMIVIILVSNITKGVKSKKSNKVKATNLSEAHRQIEIKSAKYAFDKRITGNINIDSVINAGYLPELESINSELVNCKVNITSREVNGFFDINAFLTCPNYKSPVLKDAIMNDIKSSTSNEDGLYPISSVAKASNLNLVAEADGYDPNSNPLMKGYIYRGINPNNFINVGGVFYRIIRIDGNGDLTIMSANPFEESVFDNKYNRYTLDNTGESDYATSYVKALLDEHFHNELMNSNPALIGKLVPKNSCIGSRGLDEVGTDGKIECRRVVKDVYYSLPSTFDYMAASLDPDCDRLNKRTCDNNNYLFYYPGWMQTEVLGNTNKVYTNTKKGIKETITNEKYQYYPVYYISSNVSLRGGNGSENHPYIIE